MGVDRTLRLVFAIFRSRELADAGRKAPLAAAARHVLLVPGPLQGR